MQTYSAPEIGPNQVQMVSPEYYGKSYHPASDFVPVAGYGDPSINRPRGFFGRLGDVVGGFTGLTDGGQGRRYRQYQDQQARYFQNQFNQKLEGSNRAFQGNANEEYNTRQLSNEAYAGGTLPPLPIDPYASLDTIRSNTKDQEGQYKDIGTGYGNYYDIQNMRRLLGGQQTAPYEYGNPQPRPTGIVGTPNETIPLRGQESNLQGQVSEQTIPNQMTPEMGYYIRRTPEYFMHPAGMVEAYKAPSDVANTQARTQTENQGRESLINFRNAQTRRMGLGADYQQMENNNPTMPQSPGEAVTQSGNAAVEAAVKSGMITPEEAQDIGTGKHTLADFTPRLGKTSSGKVGWVPGSRPIDKEREIQRNKAAKGAYYGDGINEFGGRQ